MMWPAQALLSILFECIAHERYRAKLNVTCITHSGVFYTEKFTNEGRRENVTLYAASQDAELDFGFGLQRVPNLTCLLYTE